MFLRKTALAAMLLMTGCKESPLPPLKVEAYVWQAAQKNAVKDAIAKSNDLVSRLHFRAAEMHWDGKEFQTQWFIKDLPTRDCGLVIRIGASASGLAWTPAQIDEVADVFRKTAAFSPSEIQCDFDCPQKRLNGYSTLLDTLQAAVGDIPIFPTALPSWLTEPEMKILIKDRAGWVLQIHSLELPSSAEDSVEIFDSKKAEAAARKAASFGIPFRIAMATYGCEVRFDADGKILDVVSEDFTEITAAVHHRSFAMADPFASAELVKKWQNHRLRGLSGIIWYRLPVKGDARNWPLETFRLVTRGETSASHPELEAMNGDATRDLSVANHGVFPLRLPREIIVLSAVVAADGGGSYQLEHSGDRVKFLLRTDAWPWLDPGKRIACGWVRLQNNEEKIDWGMAR
jgi:Protein of unknown function (DUF3142)